MSVEQYWKSLSGWPGLRSEEKGVRMKKIGDKGKRVYDTEYYDGDVN
jgi:hypothetical protein